MPTWDDMKQAELGRGFGETDLERCCRTVYGAVAWTGVNPGFAVVAAMGQGIEGQADSHEICVLDEVECFDLWELIRCCGALDAKWGPQRWFGDTTNDAAQELISEFNESADHPFQLAPSCLFDIDGAGRRMNQMYVYLLNTIKRLLNERHRRLFLKGSKVAGYLGMIEAGQVSELELGAFPAVEALGYALIEMLRDVKLPTLMPTHTGDDSVVRHEREFDHLLKSGATDPGVEFDPDYDEDDEGDYSPPAKGVQQMPD